MITDAAKVYGHIYRVTNLINGKIYIGQTTESLSRRLRNHATGNQSVLKDAIAYYGISNFSIEDIVAGYSQEELDLLEIEAINKEPCLLDQQGYNQRLGGKLQGNRCSEALKAKLKTAHKHEQKPVVQYDIDGNFVQRHASVKDAARNTGTLSSNIFTAISGKIKTAGGFIWIKEGQESSLEDKIQMLKVKKRGKRGRIILQKDIEGNVLNRFFNIKSASEKTGISSSRISEASRGIRRQTGLFVWEAEGTSCRAANKRK